MVLHVVAVDVVLLDNDCPAAQVLHIPLNISEWSLSYDRTNEQGIFQLEDAGDRLIPEREEAYGLAQAGHVGVYEDLRRSPARIDSNREVVLAQTLRRTNGLYK
jgi:hypothetical protein